MPGTSACNAAAVHVQHAVVFYAELAKLAVSDAFDAHCNGIQTQGILPINKAQDIQSTVSKHSA
jgi:hypothetical protein